MRLLVVTTLWEKAFFKTYFIHISSCVDDTAVCPFIQCFLILCLI